MAHYGPLTNEGMWLELKSIGSHSHFKSLSMHSASTHTWYVIFKVVGIGRKQVTDALSKAPGEAEAELARLCNVHAIDAVVTEDSDIFVFGATHVIRDR